MRITQVLTQASGGPCDHAADVALELAGRGHDVLVVMPSGPAARRLAASGIRVREVGPTRARDLSGAWALLHELRREGPDVVHCQDRRAGMVVRAARRRLPGARVVYTLHGVPDSLSGLVPGNLQVRPRRPLDRLAYLRAEQALAAWGGGPVVVPSRALARYVVEHVRVPARRVRVVPNGVDPHRYAPGRRHRRDGRLDVLWLGAVVPTKRVDVLLRAVAQVPEVTLRLGGTGELLPKLRVLAEDLGLGERVHWLGWVEDPSKLMADADVVALPSAAENLPLTVLQAMAAAAAVVASRVGGVPELVEDGVSGLLVEPGDVAGLAQALRRLQADARQRDALGTEARQRVLSRFALADTVDSLLEVYA